MVHFLCAQLCRDFQLKLLLKIGIIYSHKISSRIIEFSLFEQTNLFAYFLFLKKNGKYVRYWYIIKSTNMNASQFKYYKLIILDRYLSLNVKRETVNFRHECEYSLLIYFSDILYLTNWRQKVTRPLMLKLA